MRVGFLYDVERVTLRSTREYPDLDPGGDGRCDEGGRPGFLGVFVEHAGEGDERVIHLLTIHLHPGGDADDFAKRKEQWALAYRIVRALRDAGAANVAILGDANSAGWRDDTRGERRFVDDAARAADMRIATGALSCSEYWPKDGALSPSMLDHVVATPTLGARSARVHGFCARAACAPLDARDPPPDFTRVSDHCPVTVTLSP
jgi:endonuclease/exonuclease/phosphatase family metal-dependent hydrolase